MSNNEETLDDGNSVGKAKKQSFSFRDRIKMIYISFNDKKNDVKDPTHELQLQDALHAMQIQLDEANSNLLKEREAVRRINEEAPPVIKETSVLIENTEKVDSLTAEAERLEALLLSEKKRVEKVKQAFADALAKRGQLTKKLENAERKIDQLQESMLRPEKKLSNTDSENQVLHQQALENGNILSGETKMMSDLNLVASNPREPKIVQKPQKSLKEKQQDLLIKCISHDLGFSATGVPIAACIIYKCLLHWRSFSVEKTSVFDHIIKTIGLAIKGKDDNGVLSYWLSNSSTLLLLFQRTLKASDAASSTPQRLKSTSASLFERLSQGLPGSPQSGGFSFLSFQMHNGLDDIQVEANSPALLFKQQLIALLEKWYGIIRDNLKKDISPFLKLLIKKPIVSRKPILKGSHSKAHVSNPLEPIVTLQSTKPLPIKVKKKRVEMHVVVPGQALFPSWHSIVEILNSYLRTLRDNYVPPFLICNVFTQVFSFINVQLFNSLLSQCSHCSLSDGKGIQKGLAELKRWCLDATEEDAGSAWDELRHIRQAVELLVIHQRQKKTFDEVTKNICPALNMYQLHNVCTMYLASSLDNCNIIEDILSSVNIRLTKEFNDGVTGLLLLEEDSRVQCGIPFSVDDIYKLMKQQITLGDINPSPLNPEKIKELY